jgi:hypothetical protein
VIWLAVFRYDPSRALTNASCFNAKVELDSKPILISGSRGPFGTAVPRTAFATKVLHQAGGALADGDVAALWAKRTLREKSKLAAADAQRVETAFQTKLSYFAIHKADEVRADWGTETPPAGKSRRGPKKRRQPQAVDKGALALPEPRRVRDREHVRYVAQQPCLICDRRPSDAHHLRFAQSRALGRKVSDEFTVPLCRGHHREVHRYGDEAAWWTKIGVDPTFAARTLWMQTHAPASIRTGTASHTAIATGVD